MTTTEDVNRLIQKEYMEFNNSPYSGNPALPRDIIVRFKAAIFKLSPEVHKVPTKVIQAIIGKKIKDLTNVDVPTILNTISRVPFCDLYKDFDEAVVKNSEIEELKLAFNLTIMEINKQTEEKRNTLLSLSGSGNGARIIKAQA